MKKILLTIIIFVITMLMCISCIKIDGQVAYGNNEQLFVEEISKKMIRFHVLANSNSTEDQNLKLEVKSKVIEYITPKFQDVNSIEEARSILINNNDDIIKIAEEYIK
ncbi:MAG: stage II sporulation protein R, partial [Sarcina sp.]